MKTVGISELKKRLSEYIRQVRAGEEILVTHRDRVVAELRQPKPADSKLEYPGLHRLAREGRLRLGAGNVPEAYPRMPAVLSMADLGELLNEARGDR